MLSAYTRDLCAQCSLLKAFRNSAAYFVREIIYCSLYSGIKEINILIYQYINDHEKGLNGFAGKLLLTDDGFQKFPCANLFGNRPQIIGSFSTFSALEPLGTRIYFNSIHTGIGNSDKIEMLCRERLLLSAAALYKQWLEIPSYYTAEKEYRVCGSRPVGWAEPKPKH